MVLDPQTWAMKARTPSFQMKVAKHVRETWFLLSEITETQTISLTTLCPKRQMVSATRAVTFESAHTGLSCATFLASQLGGRQKKCRASFSC